jgi:hypothetical protein
MKRITAILMTVAIVMNCIFVFPLTAQAAETVETWDDFVLAFENMKDAGGTITFAEDIIKTTTAEETFSATNGVTIDTNGHSIVIEAGTVTFGVNVMITGSTDGVVPLKAAGSDEAAPAEILLAGAAVRKNVPAVGAAVEIGGYAVLRTTTGDTCIEGVNLALDVKDGGKAYHEYGSILAINTGIGAATAICVRTGGELQIISAEVGATSNNNAIGILSTVPSHVRLSLGGSRWRRRGRPCDQSGGEATVENGGISAYNGDNTSASGSRAAN